MGGNVESIERWAGKNCNALQPVLDSADLARKNGAKAGRFSCPNCPVKVAIKSRPLLPGTYKIKVERGELCSEIPPLDQDLKPKE